MGKIVYSYYSLDVCHTGHILMMENAKALAGKDGQLIIGILTDEAVMEKKIRPILPFIERLNVAKAIKFVDVVIPQTTYSPIPNIRGIRPDILAESSSHSKEDIMEAKAVMNSWGGRIVVLPYYPYQSSTSIKDQIKKKHKKEKTK